LSTWAGAGAAGGGVGGAGDAAGYDMRPELDAMEDMSDGGGACLRNRAAILEVPGNLQVLIGAI
jgi:hypothetical protein